MTWKET